MDFSTPPAPKRVKRGDEDDGDKPTQVSQQITNVVVQLPEEVLEKIFSYMETTQEAHPVSNASPQFARIMSPTKPKWAFDQVFPLIFSELDKEDILNCRLVCKKWNQIVDNTLQNSPDTRELALYPEAKKNSRPLHAPEFVPCLLNKDLFDFELVRSSQIRTFMEKTKNHPRNPLVLRSVYLDNDELSEEYWELVMSFLRRFGSEIWNLAIVSHPHDPEEIPFMCTYELACRILVHLPNLRILRVCGLVDGHVNRPLPRLPELHTVELLPNRNYQPFLNELLRSYFSQLKLISFSDLSTWLLHNLTSFLPETSSIILTVDGDPHSWGQFCLELVAPKLAKLTLNLRMEGWEMFDLLHPISAARFQSLTYLSLRFNRRPINMNNAVVVPPQLALENVKTLEIVDNGNVQYDELFRYLPNLEYLLVCHEQEPGVPNVDFDDTDQWQIFSWFEGASVYSSNIWTQLSSLRELTLARLGNNVGPSDNEYEITEFKTFTRKM